MRALSNKATRNESQMYKWSVSAKSYVNKYFSMGKVHGIPDLCFVFAVDGSKSVCKSTVLPHAECSLTVQRHISKSIEASENTTEKGFSVTLPLPVSVTSMSSTEILQRRYFQTEYALKTTYWSEQMVSGITRRLTKAI